eukprot:1576443-Amphidinium_carterae.1
MAKCFGRDTRDLDVWMIVLVVPHLEMLDCYEGCRMCPSPDHCDRQAAGHLVHSLNAAYSADARQRHGKLSDTQHISSCQLQDATWISPFRPQSEHGFNESGSRTIRLQ